MSKMIQIRHVPNDLHSRLKARAALAQMSLSDYLLAQLRRLAEQPTLDEMAQRLKRHAAINPKISPAEMIRVERDKR
jgi:plasmid stability protein